MDFEKLSKDQIFQIQMNVSKLYINLYIYKLTSWASKEKDSLQKGEETVVY